MVHIAKGTTMLMGRHSLTSAKLFTRATRQHLDTPTMSLPQKSFLSTAMDERAQSASPQPHQKHKYRSTSDPHTPIRPLSVLPDRLNTLPPSVSTSTRETPLQSLPILDATETLLRAMPAVVKARTGSVLARGFILKTDYYPNGTSLTNQHSPVLTDRHR